MFSPTIPQSQYFLSSWKIPGSGWTITGHSRALERTGFWIPELCVVLDAGVDLPTHSGAQPAAILITHGHIDHMNALPMLLRHGDGDPKLHIMTPASILYRIRQFAQLSYAVKVDDGDDLPPAYCPPPEAERGFGTNEIFEDEFNKWHAVIADSVTALSVGKKGKTPLSVRALQLFHGRCTSVGYLLSIPAGVKKKLRTDLLGSTKQETAVNVKNAKARGEEVNETVHVPEQPILSFVLDTTIEALQVEKSSTAQRILECPVIMIECTYLEDSKQQEAERRGHVWWGGLVPFVQANPSRTWVLVHFSLRYKDQEIEDFFADAEKSRVELEDGAGSRPPDLVLWLDGGPKPLWIQSFL